MRYKHILTVFFASLPILMAARTIQLVQLTDHTTGLFTRNKPALIITAVIGLIVIVVGCCCLTIKRAPLRTPRVKKPLGIAALLMAAGIGLDVFAVFGSSYAAAWQKFALLIVGVVSAVFFVLYAAKSVKKYSLEKLFYIIPTVYFALRLIVTFVSVAPLALISENAYMVLAQCSTTLFMFEFGKIANGYDKDKNYKKILLTGVLSVMFNAVFSVPQMLLLLTDFKSTEHQPAAALLSSLFIGVFVTMYLLAHFSNKNLKNHHYRGKKEIDESKFLKIDSPEQTFYYGD